MPGVSLIAAGLVGAGVVVFGVALYALGRRHRIAGRSARRPRAGSRTAPTSMAPGPRPRRPASAGRTGAAHQETVLLHEVPAWSTATATPAGKSATGNLKPPQLRNNRPYGGALPPTNARTRREPDLMPRQPDATPRQPEVAPRQAYRSR